MNKAPVLHVTIIYIHKHNFFPERVGRISKRIFSPWVTQLQDYRRDQWAGFTT